MILLCKYFVLVRKLGIENLITSVLEAEAEAEAEAVEAALF